MSSRSRSTLGAVPDWWFEPVVAVATVLAVGTAVTVFEVALGAATAGGLGPLAPAGPLLSLLVAAVLFGGVGAGTTVLYRRARGFDPIPVGLPDREGLGAAAAVAALGPALVAVDVAHGILVEGPDAFGVAVPAFASVPHLGSFPAVPVAGNELLGQVPFVLFSAAVVGALAGPATAAVLHGVLQDTLARVAPPAAAVGVTALAGVVLVEGASLPLGGPAGRPLAALPVLALVGLSGYAHHRLDDLRVPMAAYGLFGAAAVVAGWVGVLAHLAADGYLF